MKNFLITALLIISFTLTNAQQHINLQAERSEFTISQNTGLTFESTFSFTELEFHQVRTPLGIFAEMHIPDFTFRYNDGNPSIPVYSKLVEIPGNASVNIKILKFDTQIINLADYAVYERIIPAQPSYSKSTDPDDIEFVFNEAAYLVNDFTQGPIASIEYQGKARGAGIAQLIIDPVRYNPVTNQLMIFNNIEFSVEYATPSYSEYLEEKSRVYSPMFSSLYHKLPNFIPPANKDLISQYPIKYVIVSDPMFQDSLQKFVQWKTQKGFHVVEAYTNNPAVGTTTTSIKAYLQGLYNAGTPTDPAPTFVLFVGDVAQIPVFSGTAGSHPTDLYYAEYDGGTDFIPELYYGRFSATSIAQLMPQINKTLKYEKFTLPSTTYMDTVVMVSGVDGTYAITHGNGQINYGNNNYFNSANGIYSHTYLYPLSSESWVDADVRAKVSAGAGYANYTAHCNSAGWGDPSFTTSHVPLMTNINKYGLMVGNCCLSNKFNDSECFGEALLRVADKGAVGYLGGSNSTYWNEDFYWGVGYTSSISANPTYAGTGLGAYDKLFHDHGEPYSDWFVTNGQMNYAGNTAVQASTSSLKKYYWEIYHLMGDPSVMNYLWNPDPLVMSYNVPLMVGDQSLVVQCEPYTLVALSLNNLLLDSKFSGPNNSVTLQFQTLTNTGMALIVGTKQNRAPHIQSIEIDEISVPVDAQVLQIANIEDSYTCVNVNIQPEVVIRNKGINNLTQLTLNYKWNSGAIQQISWTGNLTTMDTAHILLPAYLLTSGNHQLMVYSTNPNGSIDGNLMNDTLTKFFTAQDLPLFVDFSASLTEFCNTPATVLFNNNSSNAASFTWNFGDGSSSTLENPVHEYTSLGLYTVSLTADAGICGNDQLTYNNMILVGAEPPVAFNQSHCGPASFIMTASAQSQIYWYIDATGSNLIHTGDTFVTPLLNNTTTYYLGTEIQNILYGGRADNSGTGAYFTSTVAHGLVFNCTSPTLLKSVQVYSGASTNVSRTIRLETSSGSLIQSVTVNIPPGESRITLNLNIPAGTNLKLMGPTAPNLFRNGATGMNIGYPFAAGNNISILQSTASGAEHNYYYYFYDWEVEEICESPLTKVNAYIQTTPVSDFSYIINQNQVEFTNLSSGGGGASNLWDFGDGSTSQDENPVHSYVSNGLYTVLLEVSNTCGIHNTSKIIAIITGIDEFSEMPVHIYPNPAQSFINIESEIPITMIQLFDATGKLLQSKTSQIQVFEFDLTGYGKGFYFLKLICQEGIIIRQFMIE